MPWNWMMLEINPADMRANPMIGPGELTREEAHAAIQDVLDRAAAESPAFAPYAELWRAGAKDDTVGNGLLTWTIYEHPAGTDPRRAAHEWVTDFADIMTRAGVPNIQVARFPED